MPANSFKMRQHHQLRNVRNILNVNKYCVTFFLNLLLALIKYLETTEITETKLREFNKAPKKHLRLTKSRFS